MILKTLRLINYRNYPSLEIDFEAGTTLLVGKNGQGKTNILEAIYFLSLLRSFRTSKIDLLKNYHEKAQGFAIEGVFHDDKDPQIKRTFRVTCQDKRRLFIDGVSIEKAIDFINSFICVAFVPEDIEIITGSGNARRQFVDILLCQQAPSYLHHLQHYKTALQNRNAVLKMGPKINTKLINTYNLLLIEHAIPIYQMRQELALQFEQVLTKISPLFFHDGRQLHLKYHPSVRCNPEIQNDFATQLRFALEDRMNKDWENGFTSIGIHRDDFIITLNEKPLAAFGSAGEQRISALGLRLASLQILYHDPSQHRSIILLLDDVLGELDQERRSDFFKILAHNQIFLACTEVPEEIKQNSHQFRIHQGHCCKIS